MKTKAVLSENEKTELLKKCVTVKTGIRLKNRMRRVGFYRLFLYAKFLLSKSHLLTAKPSEDMLYNLYDFDEKLRVLLFVFCKKAEINLKANISLVCTQSEENNLFYALPQSYTPSKSVNDKLEKQKNVDYFKIYLKDLLQEEKKIRTHNISKHTELVMMRPKTKKSTDRLPADVLFSYLDLGSVCNMYAYLRGDLRKAILKNSYTCKNYGKETTKQYDTWLDAIRNLRNCCAHHNILVGKTSNIILAQYGEEHLLSSATDLFSRLYALKKVLPQKDAQDLGTALEKLVLHGKTDVELLGILPCNWKEKYDEIKFL